MIMSILTSLLLLNDFSFVGVQFLPLSLSLTRRVPLDELDGKEGGDAQKAIKGGDPQGANEGPDAEGAKKGKRKRTRGGRVCGEDNVVLFCHVRVTLVRHADFYAMQGRKARKQEHGLATHLLNPYAFGAHGSSDDPTNTASGIELTERKVCGRLPLSLGQGCELSVVILILAGDSATMLIPVVATLRLFMTLFILAVYLWKAFL